MSTTAFRRAGLGAAAGLTMLALAAPATAETGDAASLSVLHGVPGLTVDVWVNGERTLDDFEPASLAGPLELPAGTYSVAITAADAGDDSEPVLGPLDLPLEAGGNYTAVAHLDADGAPTASFFTNDTTATAAGEGRLTVRHTAAAPAVDVLAGGEAVISDLANGSEQSLDLPAGTVSATVAAAGTTDPVIGPADIPVEEGVSTIVYAWGSLEEDSLAVATQTIEGLHSAPGGVPTGLVPVDEGSTTGVVLAAGLGALLLAGVAGTVGARRVARAKV
ncbi:DUF4397 domain-containing protein [Georgenia sp. H159]|uniref:DUF4397 domain-containing protein n=1 Tax=Georgenia sp. H159 TaxID=3076115 RepID=UPI002D76C3E4|nr:DUF4397 domain-containing protein [Georgenia sp. H159]